MDTTLKTHRDILIRTLAHNGVSDENVLAAVAATPREFFVPPELYEQAYDDRALPIGRGQTISQPTVVALMTQALEVNDRHKVLEIGTGSGYQASILARLSRRVYSIERHKPLLEAAEETFKRQRLHNITAIAGDGMKGWPEQAPFDRIIVTAAAPKAPQALLDQLAVGGIMVIPVGGMSETQQLRRYKRESEDTYSSKDFLPVRFVPLVPDIAEDIENGVAA